MSCSKAVYREILREAAKLSVGPVRRKICYNTRELFDLYRTEQDPTVVQKLRDDGAAAVRVIAWLTRLSEVPTSLMDLLQAGPSAVTKHEKHRYLQTSLAHVAGLVSS